MWSGNDHCKLHFLKLEFLTCQILHLKFCVHFSGKMARLSSLSSSQSVSFRHGTNVEFNSPGFQPSTGPPGTGTIEGVPPMEGYNLQAISNKSRDFSNPMYDAVQSGTNSDPIGSGE